MSHKEDTLVNVEELYEMVKDMPEFKSMGMDEQGEFILHLQDSMATDIEEAFAMLDGS